MERDLALLEARPDMLVAAANSANLKVFDTADTIDHPNTFSNYSMKEFCCSVLYIRSGPNDHAVVLVVVYSIFGMMSEVLIH